MEIQAINNQPNFGQKLKFDTRVITRATSEEKSELAALKRLFKDYRDDKSTIKIKYDKNVTIQDIINDLKFKYEKLVLKKDM